MINVKPQAQEGGLGLSLVSRGTLARSLTSSLVQLNGAQQLLHVGRRRRREVQPVESVQHLPETHHQVNAPNTWAGCFAGFSVARTCLSGSVTNGRASRHMTGMIGSSLPPRASHSDNMHMNMNI